MAKTATQRQLDKEIRKQKGKLNKDNVYGYLLIAPWLLGLFAFQIGPIFYSLYLSLSEYSILKAPEFVGFENYVRMFQDTSFYTSVGVTLSYVFMSVPAKLFFALVVALIMNTKLKGIGFYRTVYYIPSIFGSSIAVAILWKSLFVKDGVINLLLDSIGIEGPSWLGDPKYVLFTFTLLSVWQFGSSMVVFLGGLKQIPASLYEAAQIDGAGVLKRFFHITIPGLIPMIWFNILMQLIFAFQTFASPYTIFDGSGGPMDSCLLLVIYVYRQGFNYFNMGYAAALSWALLLMVAVIAGILSLLKRYFLDAE